MIALGAYVWSRTTGTSSDFNITSVLFAAAPRWLHLLGQPIALLIGGIDLSVGPLAGLPGRGRILLRHRRESSGAHGRSGSSLMLALAAAVGAVQRHR